MANILTEIRIICGLLILVFPAFSGWYYALYILGGITDAIDGTVARKLGKESDFGAKFDTAADFIFAISVVIKLVSALYVPVWLIIWIAIIIVIKIVKNITMFFVKAALIIAIAVVLIAIYFFGVQV